MRRPAQPKAQISVKGLDPVAAGFLDSDAGVSLLADIDAHASSDGQTRDSQRHRAHREFEASQRRYAAPNPLDLSYSVVHRLREISGQINDVAVQIGNAAIHVSGIYQPVTPGALDPLLRLEALRAESADRRTAVVDDRCRGALAERFGFEGRDALAEPRDHRTGKSAGHHRTNRARQYRGWSVSTSVQKSTESRR